MGYCASSPLPPTLTWRGDFISTEGCFNLVTQKTVKPSKKDVFFCGCRVRGPPNLVKEFIEENSFSFDGDEPRINRSSFYEKIGKGWIEKVIDEDTYDLALYYKYLPMILRVRLRGISAHKYTEKSKECISFLQDLRSETITYHLYSFDK